MMAKLEMIVLVSIHYPCLHPEQSAANTVRLDAVSLELQCNPLLC